MSGEYLRVNDLVIELGIFNQWTQIKGENILQIFLFVCNIL